MDQPSPLFPAIKPLPEGKLLTTCFKQSLGCADIDEGRAAGVTPQISIMVTKLHADDAEPVQDIAEAENQLLDLVPVLYDCQNKDDLRLLAMRAANRIASKTRRAAGNVLLCHPDNVECMSQYEHTWYSAVPGDKCGRWTNVGATGNMEVFTSEDMATDKVVVAYVGNDAYDAPAALTQDGETLLLHLRSLDGDVIGSTPAFMAGIKLA